MKKIKNFLRRLKWKIYTKKLYSDANKIRRQLLASGIVLTF